MVFSLMGFEAGVRIQPNEYIVCDISKEYARVGPFWTRVFPIYSKNFPPKVRYYKSFENDWFRMTIREGLIIGYSYSLRYLRLKVNLGCLEFVFKC